MRIFQSAQALNNFRRLRNSMALLLSLLVLSPCCAWAQASNTDKTQLEKSMIISDDTPLDSKTVNQATESLPKELQDLAKKLQDPSRPHAFKVTAVNFDEQGAEPQLSTVNSYLTLSSVHADYTPSMTTFYEEEVTLTLNKSVVNTDQLHDQIGLSGGTPADESDWAQLPDEAKLAVSALIAPGSGYKAYKTIYPGYCVVLEETHKVANQPLGKDLWQVKSIGVQYHVQKTYSFR